MNVINKENLEKLLTARWTDFLEFRKLIAFVLAAVRDNNESLPVYEEDKLPSKGVEISIPRFTIKDDGFLLWIDFTVPQDEGFAIGTCECYLFNTGELQLNRIVGQILKSR